MNIALVYDRVVKWGGAERVLLALHALYPEAPLYTAVYDKNKTAWADCFRVIPSGLNNIPYIRLHHELFPWMTEYAFESFNFDAYDLVISVTSSDAKAIITKPGTCHICYCLTPTRYLWSGFREYSELRGFDLTKSIPALGLRISAHMLRGWDTIASNRPDFYIAISGTVKKRINRYYNRPVESVIYPPVRLDPGEFAQVRSKRNNFFLTTGRLVRYKRFDIVVSACTRLGIPLVVIGDGNERKNLGNIAGPTVTFIDHYLTDAELVRYYKSCRAFIFAGNEDFGLAAAEAQMFGAPVIAYADSGIAEIIHDKVTGLLFHTQSVDALVDAIDRFNTMQMNEDEISKSTIRFNERSFTADMKHTVEYLFNMYHKKHSHL